jgi:hypothetical protein
VTTTTETTEVSKVTETAEATAAATEQDPLAVSGHAYPETAKPVAETYSYQLGRLRGAVTRWEAAERAQSLAKSACAMAAVLTGDPEAAEDTHTDTLAWTDLATFLGSLAMALRGARVDPDDTFDAYDYPHYESWEHLAQAASRIEFAAAWYPLGQNLRQRAGLDGTARPDDEDDEDAPPLRAFAAAQVVKAAAAIINAPW